MSISNALFGGVLNLMEQALDASAFRHRIILSNLANADTPGYKAFDLVLREVSAGSSAPRENFVSTSHPGHFPIKQDQQNYQLLERDPYKGDSLRGDGNTVSLDMEMTAMAENAIRFEALARITRHRFQLLNEAINGGSKET